MNTSNTLREANYEHSATHYGGRIGVLELRTCSIPLSLLVATALAGNLHALPVRPDFTADVEAEQTQPAGAPILIQITLSNISKRPSGFGSGGPGRYPSADLFSARITDSRGKTWKVELDNGQYRNGSQQTYPIPAGQAVVLPAAVEPLPPGSYTVEVTGGRVIRAAAGNTVKITVKDDRQLTRAREQDLLRRARQGEPFAQYVVGKYPAEPVTRALLQDLLSEDRQLAFRAAAALFRFETLPPDSGPVLDKAMRLHLAAEEKKRVRDTALLNDLAFVAAKVGSDEAMSAVLALARSGMGAGTRGSAIGCLGQFKQTQAANALRDFLKENDEQVRFEAARALARRKDPAAIDVLLAVAGDSRSQWRAYAYPALANYPADARVETAIKNGLSDPDVRSQAQQALRELQKK